MRSLAAPWARESPGPDESGRAAPDREPPAPPVRPLDGAEASPGADPTPSVGWVPDARRGAVPARLRVDPTDTDTVEGGGYAVAAASGPGGEVRGGRRGALHGLLLTLRAGRFDPGPPGVAVLVAVALAAAGLSGWFLLGSRPAPVPAPPPTTVVEQPGASGGSATATLSGPVTSGPASSGSPASAPGQPAAEVVVAVAGTVARPGVVRLPAGSRVVDAVEAAGGLLPGADPGLLNLARVLGDGEQVLVGVQAPPGAAVAGGQEADGALGADGLLDLNTATAADLDELPGVGPVLAERIVEHRERAGRFASVDQLREVDGIGESRYDDLAPRVVVR